jgi:hypothetical protein
MNILTKTYVNILYFGGINLLSKIGNTRIGTYTPILNVPLILDRIIECV